MKTRDARMKLIAMVIAMLALAAVWGVGRVAAIQDSEDVPSPFGLATGQTARLSVLNVGEKAIVGPEYKLLDSAGRTLAQSADRDLILPGQFRSIDFDLPDPPPGISDHFGRIQVRAVVIGNPDTKLRVSLEVFDNATGRTSFVLQPIPNPQASVAAQ